MKTYSFKTKDNFRVDVYASNPKAGFNKIKSIPYLRDQMTEPPLFIEYDKNGIGNYNFKLLKN